MSFTSKLLTIAIVSASVLPARVGNAASYDRVKSHLDRYIDTGSLESLCFAFGENRKLLSKDSHDPQANLNEAYMRYEGYNFNSENSGDMFSPQAIDLVGNCPYGQSFSQIVPPAFNLTPDTYYHLPLLYNLDQAANGGINHPEFFSFYARFLLETNDIARAAEITEMGITKAPRGSSAESIAELYFQSCIANTKLMEQAAQSMSSPQTPLIDIPLIGEIGGKFGRQSVDDMTRYYRQAKQAIEQSLELREHSDVRDYLQYLEQKAEALGIS